MALVDAVFLIDLMRGRERAIAVLDTLEDEGEPVCLATTTLAEFFRGLATVAVSPERKRRIVDAVKGRPLLPLDTGAAQRAGEIDATLWARGEPIDPEDAALAGIALSRDMVLVTRRAREFERVDGLRLRPY
jgi:tRNA(fMet)-specific endonuclease VapC